MRLFIQYIAGMQLVFDDVVMEEYSSFFLYTVVSMQLIITVPGYRTHCIYVNYVVYV